MLSNAMCTVSFLPSTCLTVPSLPSAYLIFFHLPQLASLLSCQCAHTKCQTLCQRSIRSFDRFELFLAASLHTKMHLGMHTHTLARSHTHTHTHLGRVNERMRVVAAAEAMANLAPLLERTVTLEGTVHELSSLVADPGAPRQCIHADTSVHPQP